MLKDTKIILYCTILNIFWVWNANEKFSREKLLLLFPRYYKVLEKFWIPFFRLEKKKSEKNQQKLARVVTGQKWKNEERRKESWQKLFLRFLHMQKMSFCSISTYNFISKKILLLILGLPNLRNDNIKTLKSFMILILFDSS